MTPSLTPTPMAETADSVPFLSIVPNIFPKPVVLENMGLAAINAAYSMAPDGNFRMVIAHQDPGCDNWIDTEGRTLGLVSWRFFLPEEEVQTPQPEVVKFSDL